MWLDRALQLHVAALAVLGAIFVGLRHEAPIVPALAALAAVVAFFLTDVLGRVRLNRWVANAIIVVAVVWSLREFVQISPEEKLLAISSMLCYLQMVLLFQEKGPRIYWQLIVLSTLQVVVAAALDLGPQFGLLLALFAVIAIGALVLLCIHRETRGRVPVTIGRSTAERPAWHVLLAELQISAAEATAARTERSLTPRVLIRQTALLTAVTVLFAVVFFYATPRLGEGSWLGGRSGQAVTGLKPEIRLEPGGRVHLSSQVVMRVALSKMPPDRRSVELIGEPYFHGALLTEYQPDDRGGRWVPWRAPAQSTEGQREQRGGLMRTVPQTTTSLVRQDIVLEASTSSMRYAIMPTQPYTDLLTVPYGSPSRREGDSLSAPRQRRYSVATPAISGDRQLHAIPNPNRRQSEFDIANFEAEIERCTVFDASRFPKLAELAADAVQQHNLTKGASYDKALALERHFQVAGAYHYSLHLDFPRDLLLDPVEDFVANHRTGHCEYFASALALMLRSQKLPARIVMGYKGGTFNSVGRYYVVEQRHAHSWVEAWMPSEEVPPSEFAGVPSDGGAWYRLDPTPGRDSYVTLHKEGIGTRLAQAFDYVELLWRDYVLSLSTNRQNEIVYEPLTAKAAILPSWVESRSFQRWLRRMSTQWGLELPNGSRSGVRAIEGSAAVLVVAGLVSLLAVVYALRAAGRAVGHLRRPRSAASATSGAEPNFYRRLERLLAKLPLVRRRGQTPRELAVAAQAELAAVEGAALTAQVPAELVSAYYRVRFGGGRLDKNETEAIEQALASLAPAVSQIKKR